MYCCNQARGHDSCGKQCNYCYHYQQGLVEPTSPVPAITLFELDYATWYSNLDGFWNKPHGRMI